MPQLMRGLRGSGVRRVQSGSAARHSILGTPFLPSTVGGLVLWLRANTGTFQTVGGVAAAADADPVGEWKDQSGSGNDVSQATAGFRPLLKTNIQSGKPVVRFDGVDDILRSGNITQAQPLTFFLIMKVIVRTDFAQVVSFGGGNGNGFKQSNVIDRYALDANDDSSNVSYTGLDLSTFELLTILYNGASSELWFNTVSQGTGNPGTNGFAGTTLSLARSGPGGSASYSNIDVAELLVYGAVLSAADRASVEAYLNKHWGVY